MKLAKRFAALLMGATLAVGSIAGLTACDFGGNGDSNNNAGTDNTQNSGSQSSEMEEQIRAVYDLYKANCAENNVTPQTYEEWLALIRGVNGQDGKDGITPHIGRAADGEDEGYWYFGDEKSEYKAVGADGDDGQTPEIGEDGYWYLYGTKTKYRAVAEDGKSAYELYVEQYKAEHDGSDKGVLSQDMWLLSLKGETGQVGQRGSKWFFYAGPPTTAPAGTFGKYYVNDFCLDTTTWNVWVYQAGEHVYDSSKWVKLGCIKGADGGGAAEVKYETEVDLKAGESAEVSVEGLEAGPHLVLIDTGTVRKPLASSEFTNGQSEWRMQVGDASYYSLFGHSYNISEAEGSKIAYGFIVVHENDTKATFSTVGTSCKGKITIKKEVWTPDLSNWTAEGGGYFIVPINGLNMPSEDIIKFTFPEGLTSGTTWTGMFTNAWDYKFTVGSQYSPGTKIQIKLGDGTNVTNFVGGMCPSTQPGDKQTYMPWNAFQKKALTQDLTGQQGYLSQVKAQDGTFGKADAKAIWPISMKLTKSS